MINASGYISPIDRAERVHRVSLVVHVAAIEGTIQALTGTDTTAVRRLIATWHRNFQRQARGSSGLNP